MEKEKDEFGGELPKTKPRITEEMRNALRADFPDEAYKQHDSKNFLTTLKAMYIVERLNDVFGIGRWNLRHSVLSHEKGYVLMKGSLVILDYDCHIPEQYGGHITEGTNVSLDDGYKSAITAILSKSASYLEIGIEMFKGLISPPGNDGNKGSYSKAQPLQKDQVPEFMKVWNGKIYKGNSVYFNNVKYQLSDEQAEWLKKSEKYKQDTDK